MAVTLEDYLKNNKTIQAAQKKVNAAQAALSREQKALSGIPANSGANIRSQVEARLAAAQEELNAIKTDFESAKAKATEYFNKNVATINERADVRTAAADKDKLADAVKMRERLVAANQPTTTIDNSIQDITDRINKTGKYAPKAEKGAGAGAAGEGAGGYTPRDYATELATTGQAVAKMTGPQRKALAQKLSDAGYKVTVTDVYNQNLIDSYTQAIVENRVRSDNFQQEIAFETFLDTKAQEAAALGAGGTGGTGLTGDEPYAAIANPTQAAGIVNQVIKSTLGRDATPAEIKTLGVALVEAQRKNPVKTKLNKQGVVERTGGIDPTQFIFAEIQKLPEYKDRLASENDVTVQSLAKTAKANGLNLTDNFDSEVVDSWVKRIRAGEDPEVFKNKIRQQAFRAMPQAVRDSLDPELDLNANFATYINSYAKTFGVPANQVDVMRIIPLATDEKGFLSVPAYEKKKRTLTEWQYTPEAKEEVSNIASRVLQDFGFQG